MTNNAATGLDLILNPFQLFTIPLEQWITIGLKWIVENFRPIFQFIRMPIKTLLEGVREVLITTPPAIALLVLTLIAWQLAGRKIGLYSFLSLTLIGFVGIWQEAMVSLALVLTSVVVCLVLGIPLGVACARSDRFSAILQPILDAMQTLPVFVYLVPVVMLFGIGEVPGVIATVVYAIPPLIRLTNLGIRQVPKDVIEASISFGATPNQLLWGTQIPLAMPTLLAGVNQTVLFALGMSVVTSMIAVPGLGLIVLKGLSTLNVGMATVGGLGILLMAILLDRVTQTIGQLNRQHQWQTSGPIGCIMQFFSLRKQRTSVPDDLLNP